jgi:hypothetical protein
MGNAFTIHPSIEAGSKPAAPGFAGGKLTASAPPTRSR